MLDLAHYYNPAAWTSGKATFLSPSNPSGAADNSGEEFAALYQRATAGDSDAQNQLCQHYEAKVRVVARVLLGPALRPFFDTLDIVQSVHKSLLVGLRHGKFDITCPEQLVALAGLMVRRKVARKWQNHRREQERRIRGGGLDSSGFAMESAPGHDEPPEQVVAYQEQLKHVEASLNDIERSMLRLRLTGHNATEVAAQLGLHPVAVRVRWTRLRKRLEQAGIGTEWM